MIGNTLFFSWNAKSNRSIVSSKLLIAKHGWDETKPTTSLQPTQLVSQMYKQQYSYHVMLPVEQ